MSEPFLILQARGPAPASLFSARFWRLVRAELLAEETEDLSRATEELHSCTWVYALWNEHRSEVGTLGLQSWLFPSPCCSVRPVSLCVQWGHVVSVCFKLLFAFVHGQKTQPSIAGGPTESRSERPEAVGIPCPWSFLRTQGRGQWAF